MTRYVVNVFLDSFYTKKSGDIGEGEFYFLCNKKRFPDEGVIKMKKNETFDPEPNPTFFWGIVDSKKDKMKMEFKVKEQDPLKDDTFLKEKIEFTLKNQKQVFTLTDKKGICELKVGVQIKITDKW